MVGVGFNPRIESPKIVPRRLATPDVTGQPAINHALHIGDAMVRRRYATQTHFVPRYAWVETHAYLHRVATRPQTQARSRVATPEPQTPSKSPRRI